MPYRFTPPTTTFRAGTDSLWGRVKNARGRAVVLYDSGRVSVADEAPSQSESGVVSVWPGGRTYDVTDEQATILAEAGYGSFLSEVA